LPTGDPLFEPGDDAEASPRTVELAEVPGGERRRRRRGRRITDRTAPFGRHTREGE
jgi:hypothetical protein